MTAITHNDFRFGSGWKRKLPFSDEQISDALKAGISVKKMAEFFGVCPQAVGKAVSRARDLPSSARSVSPRFWAAGNAGRKKDIQPVAHRETQAGPAYGVSMLRVRDDDQTWTDIVDPLELHECADLLSEWGVSD